MFLFTYFLVFRAAPAARRSSRARARIGAAAETYATATAAWDPSRICDLPCSLRQYWILIPLSKARDQTCILMDTSWVLHPLSHNGNAQFFFKKRILCVIGFPKYLVRWVYSTVMLSTHN